MLGNSHPNTMNTFAITLHDQRKGALSEELSAEFRKLVEHVRGIGKAGTLTLKLTVRPTEGGDGSTVVLEDDVSVKLPRPKKAKSLFFTTDDGRLTRNDPNQAELPLKTVPGATPEPLRQVN